MTEEQREWIDRVANEHDESRSDVLQRVIRVYRDGTNKTEEPSDPDRSNGHAEGLSEAEQSRAELLERIESLEESLRARDEQEAREEYDDDDGMGWR